MKRTLYIQDEPTGSQKLRRLLITLLTLALIAGGVVGFYIMSGERRAATILDDFTQAMAESRYDDAIELYRVTQGKALTDNWVEQYKDKYQAALKAMESSIAGRVSKIQDELMKKHKLSSDDLAFSEGMAEASAVRLTGFLRNLCASFMVGDVDMPTLENAFGQLAQLANLKESIGGLPDQFPVMEAAQPLMMTAAADLASGRYWEAWQQLDDIVHDETMTGFVHDQASLRRDECETAMYQPLLDAAVAKMNGGRYLTARTALEKMATVYRNGEDIQDYISECSEHLPKSFVEYSGQIEFLSIKPLIVRPDLAFDGDAYAATADDTMLTVDEFRNMLEQLYANNYILIDASRVYTDDRKRASLQLPAGKKPLVLVLEGLNYYATRRQTGNCWDLVLDEGGEVSGLYQGQDGQMVADRKAEAIGILDLFVAEHPDFSHDGAKGTISLTGYECVFGKVTDADQLDDRNQALTDNGFTPIELSEADIVANRADTQEIVDRLLETGWQFACSTYGFIDASGASLERLQADTTKWMNQVGSLTGPVQFFNYPSGAFLSGSDDRAAWLRDQGFILFGGLGTTPYLYAGNGYIYVDKTPINGFTLRNAALYNLGRLFDDAKVLDR